MEEIIPRKMAQFEFLFPLLIRAALLRPRFRQQGNQFLDAPTTKDLEIIHTMKSGPIGFRAFRI